MISCISGSAQDLFLPIEEEDIKEALQTIGKKGVAQMRSGSAVDTGASKKSVKAQIKRLNAGGYGLVVRFHTDYYGYQEFGSSRSNPANVGKVYGAIQGLDEEAVKILEELVTRNAK